MNDKIFILMFFLFFMKVYFERTNEIKEINFSGSVLNLLNNLGIKENEVIVVRVDLINGVNNQELLLNTDELTNEDYVKILSVISGG